MCVGELPALFALASGGEGAGELALNEGEAN